MPPGPEEVSAVTITAAEDRNPVAQPDNVDADDQFLTGARTSSTASDHRPTVESFISSIIAFANIRETDIVDDDASVSLSASGNDLRDADFRFDAPPTVSGDDEAHRRLLKNFIDSKETDIVSDPDVTVQGRSGRRSRESSKQQTVQSRPLPAVHSGTGAADTEVKVAALNVPGRIKRQKTIGAASGREKVKKSSQPQKSKSFSQADELANRDCARRIYSRNKRSVPPRRTANLSATDCSGGSGSQQTSHNALQSTNSNRLSTKDAATSARKDGRTTAKGRDDGADMQPRTASSVPDARENSRKRKLVRSHSTKQSTAERQTLRRNVTVTATDNGVGGLAASNLMSRSRRRVAPNLAVKSPVQLTRQDSLDSSESAGGGSQDSFVTARGDSVIQLDSETADRGSANRRHVSDDSDDDNDDDGDNFSTSYNQEVPDSPTSRNSCRCEKSSGAALTSDDGHGPIVCRADEDDAEDDVVVGHVAEAKVSVPISICLIIIAAYIVAGSALFAEWENWDYLTGSYFCFITLSTIGFGDVVPGTDMDQWSSHEKLVLCALWLAFGLSLLAMCFNLMQEEVKEKCKRIGRKLGLLKADN